MNPLRISRLAMVLAACGCGASAPSLEFVEGCTSATLGPLAGVTPRITWPEDCGVAVIAVVPAELNAEFGGSVWAISGDGNNVLRSGVTYGDEHDFARTWVQPSPLTPGQSYRVELRVESISSRSAWGSVVASRVFTP
jgi:hypothetical protein